MPTHGSLAPRPCATSTLRSAPVRTSHSSAASSITFSSTICGSKSTRSAFPIFQQSLMRGSRTQASSTVSFSGWDEESRSYKYDSWQYQGEIVPASLAEHYVNTTESFSEKTKRMEKGPPPRD